jgi:hypothetical protein
MRQSRDADDLVADEAAIRSPPGPRNGLAGGGYADGTLRLAQQPFFVADKR